MKIPLSKKVAELIASNVARMKKAIKMRLLSILCLLLGNCLFYEVQCYSRNCQKAVFLAAVGVVASFFVLGSWVFDFCCFFVDQSPAASQHAAREVLGHFWVFRWLSTGRVGS